MHGPRLVVAGHVISASAGHGDLRSFYASRWELPVSAIADGTTEIRRLVRREHAYGADWIKTANAGGYFSVGDDPARPTWFDEEMDALCSAARLLGMPVAVHTGAADACKQAIRCGARARSDHASANTCSYCAACHALEHTFGVRAAAVAWVRGALESLPPRPPLAADTTPHLVRSSPRCAHIDFPLRDRRTTP